MCDTNCSMSVRERRRENERKASSSIGSGQLYYFGVLAAHSQRQCHRTPRDSQADHGVVTQGVYVIQVVLLYVFNNTHRYMIHRQ